jgi:hypothetical protein
MDALQPRGVGEGKPLRAEPVDDRVAVGERGVIDQRHPDGERTPGAGLEVLDELTLQLCVLA